MTAEYIIKKEHVVIEDDVHAMDKQRLRVWWDAP